MSFFLRELDECVPVLLSSERWFSGDWLMTFAKIMVWAMGVLWSMRENAIHTSQVLEGINNNKNTTKLIKIQDKVHG